MPRKTYRDFHADIFPDTASAEPVMVRDFEKLVMNDLLHVDWKVDGFVGVDLDNNIRPWSDHRVLVAGLLGEMVFVQQFRLIQQTTLAIFRGESFVRNKNLLWNFFGSNVNNLSSCHWGPFTIRTFYHLWSWCFIVRPQRDQIFLTSFAINQIVIDVQIIITILMAPEMSTNQIIPTNLCKVWRNCFQREEIRRSYRQGKVGWNIFRWIPSVFCFWKRSICRWY